MTHTSFGSGEPVDGRELRPDAFGVILIPGVAFDRDGRRIGYGGGYYDRFLRLTRDGGFSVAIAFSVQLLDRSLPAGSFDLRVDAIVTERETVRPSRTRPST